GCFEQGTTKSENISTDNNPADMAIKFVPLKVNELKYCLNRIQMVMDESC
ncbi:hypothetical protein TorRG33x02_207040, partial [Trema orientale]